MSCCEIYIRSELLHDILDAVKKILTTKIEASCEDNM